MRSIENTFKSEKKSEKRRRFLLLFLDFDIEFCQREIEQLLKKKKTHDFSVQNCNINFSQKVKIAKCNNHLSKQFLTF